MRDSRLSNQIRTISCSTGILHKADGSSKFSLGESSVLAGVFGPVSVPIKLEKIDAAQLIVTVDPLSGTGGTFEKTLAAQIRNSLAAIIDLRSFPRSSIQVNLQILAQDGLILPVALNAAVIACIDAGIPMSSMIGSISVCVKADGEVVLDPDQGEVDSSSSRHVFAYEEKTGGLVLQESWGTFSVSDVSLLT
jgi:exosome complex component RRP46